MSKEILACDIDEVLFPFLEYFLYDYNRANGTQLTRQDFDSYHFNGPLGLSVAETVDLIYDFTGSDHSHIEPIEGADEAIARLAKKYEIDLVTARHPQFEVDTWRYLQRKLPDSFRGIKSIGYAPVMEKPVTKAQICKSIGAIALIDDSLEHVAECPQLNIEGVLFGDYPWNKTESLPAGVVRCNDWQAVAEYFNV